MVSFNTAVIFAAMASRVFASPTALEPRATPKVYLCGDSTMATNGGGSGTQGKRHLRVYAKPSFLS
jgi:hypothetical protein